MGFDEKAEQTQAELAQPILRKPEQALVKAEEEWSTGLCDCCSQPGGGALGCVACCMPFVQYGILASQLPKGSVFQAGSFGGPAACFLCLDIVAALSNCSIWPGISLLPTSALLGMQMRSHLRRKYNIKGSGCGDLCTAWWCGPCALAQETRELIIRAAREHQAAVAAGATAAPMPLMMGNLLLPPPMPAPAAYVSAPAMVASAPAAPATGFPVPPTHVATVTLEREAAK